MKPKSILLAAMLAMFAASAATAFSAEEAKAEKAEAAKSDSIGAKKPAKKKVKKHSHMEEKTGMPMSEPAAGSKEKKDPKQMHDHTQDKH